MGVGTLNRGQKLFELTNHLGNVLATVTDRLLPVPDASGILVDYNLADVASANDYYPFGMVTPGRSFSAGTQYGYGFNGQEKSTEIGDGLTTAEYWEYDGRIGRRWNLDPVVKPWENGYATFGGNPIANSDPLGDVPKYYEVKKGETLSSIAKSNGWGNDYQGLASLNGLKDPNKIKVGQVLTIGSLGSPSDLEPAHINPSYSDLTKEHPQVALAVSGAYSTALSLYTGSYGSYASVSSDVMNNLSEKQKQHDFETNSPKTTAILLWEYLTGTGYSQRSFGENAPITQEIMGSESSRLAAWYAANLFTAGKFKDGETKDYYAGMAPGEGGIGKTESIRRHINAYMTTPASFYRGGMMYHMTRAGNDLTVKITDAYTVNSMIRVKADIQRIPGEITPLGKTTVEFNFTWKDAFKK